MLYSATFCNKREDLILMVVRLRDSELRNLGIKGLCQNRIAQSAWQSNQVKAKVEVVIKKDNLGIGEIRNFTS
jgi:hypothetical protein